MPAFTIVLQVPYIPGRDTSKNDKMPSWMKFNRKALHINTDKSNAKQLQALMQVTKDRDMTRYVWGTQVRPSKEIVSRGRGDKTPLWIINNVKSYVGKHVNFHCSMTAAGLLGMWDLDTDVPYYSASNIDEIAGFLFTRQVLYNHVKTSDGHSLFAEIHQQGGMANVEAVLPNTPKAENMVEMMNKNMIGYLRN